MFRFCVAIVAVVTVVGCTGDCTVKCSCSSGESAQTTIHGITCSECEEKGKKMKVGDVLRLTIKSPNQIRELSPDSDEDCNCQSVWTRTIF